MMVSRTCLERQTIDGDSPVNENILTSRRYPKYHGTREILWESGGTILQG